MELVSLHPTGLQEQPPAMQIRREDTFADRLSIDRCQKPVHC